MVSLRSGKTASEDNVSNPSVKEKGVAKRSAHAQAEDKENKKPKVASARSKNEVKHTQPTEAVKEANGKASESAAQDTEDPPSPTADATDHEKQPSEAKKSIEKPPQDANNDSKPTRAESSNNGSANEENEKAGRPRDRRPTPGRNYAAVNDPKVRDNLSDPSPPQREADKLQKEIDAIPRRKGPKSALQKDLEFRRDTFLNPSETFHTLYICYAKGPNGSPTYDKQGFELSYDKVAQWMKPVSVRSLKPTMGKMKKEEERKAKEDEEHKRMAAILCEDGAVPEEIDFWQVDIWKDRVSKDLNVPWHKIELKHFEEWNGKGFEKVKKGEYDQVGREDQQRILGMHEGSALRK